MPKKGKDSFFFWKTEHLGKTTPLSSVEPTLLLPLPLLGLTQCSCQASEHPTGAGCLPIFQHQHGDTCVTLRSLLLRTFNYHCVSSRPDLIFYVLMTLEIRFLAKLNCFTTGVDRDTNCSSPRGLRILSVPKSSRATCHLCSFRDATGPGISKCFEVEMINDG